MIEFYPQIKVLHVAAVLGSGSLFLLRGLVVQAGRQWAMAPPLRFLSYGIDTVLLGAAVLLVVLLPSAAFANGWLTAKLVLLIAYIGLGTFALKRGRTQRVRFACFAGAIAVYGAMLAIARTHDPLALLRWVIA